MNSIVAENKVNVHYSPSALQSIKEKLITIDLINQLDIADGLKELLISNGFTLSHRERVKGLNTVYW